jgi:hypothetical protein
MAFRDLVRELLEETQPPCLNTIPRWPARLTMANLQQLAVVDLDLQHIEFARWLVGTGRVSDE